MAWLRGRSPESWWPSHLPPLDGDRRHPSEKSGGLEVPSYGARLQDGRDCASAPHDLRHRYASVQTSRGVPVTQVAAQLGHSRKSLTLDTYSHVKTRD